MKKATSFKLFILSFFILVLHGCAARAPQEPVLIYPSPPEDPKVVYLKSHRGEGDFQEKSFWDAVFGTTAAQGLPKAYGVYASGDKLYVAVTGGGYVAVIDTRARKVGYLGAEGTGKLALPIGVAGASDGTIFVSDPKLTRVYGYDGQGNLRIAIGGKDEFQNPAGIAVNNDLQRLYVVDSYAHAVRVYSTAGKFLLQFGSRGGLDGQFNFPSNVAVDKRNGTVYVVDTQNFRVQAFDKDGKFLRKFGDIGDRPGNFARPKGIGIDSEGHLYVADAAFDNFQILDENGVPLLFIGGAGTEPGRFQLPAGLYVDENDRIYIADSMNGRVQVYQYLSEKWKKEHPEEYKKYQLQ